ncbi:FUSC family protein [Nocardioides sp. P86]|uniref:FUSC family protein n=1 Tax=Nocardioides sp. P86 TaxID=2939569 RepID=UPI00203F5776|nr:FUSC family protein [Nocardioides sp. P86]MCM3514303.1 FUSC family protein [Nocardioides sp. P86]
MTTEPSRPPTTTPSRPRGGGGGRLRDQLLALGPHDGAHRVAARAGVSILVPLLVLLAAGRLEWALYATFGAFAALYARDRGGAERRRMQLTLATLLVLAVGLGTVVATSPQRAWLAVPLAAGVAALGSTLSDRHAWHPPGALFLVFAFGATASVPSTASDVPVALGVAAASAALAVVVGGLGATVRARRGGSRAAGRPGTGAHTVARAAAGATAGATGGATVVAATRVAPTDVRRHALRAALGVALAGALATATGIGHPYWAMVSAVVPLAARDPRAQAVRGLHRLLGTGVGLLVAAALLGLDLEGLGLVLVVVALQVTAELLVGRNYALALVAITPLALLMVHLASPVPVGTLLLDRAVETLLGVAVGLAVGRALRRRP